MRATVAIALALAFAGAPASPGRGQEPDGPTAAGRLFARDNLVAWCIVPFDVKRRGPDERAAMLAELEFSKFAYDWRAEHLPAFEEELRALRARDIELAAVWFPSALNDEGRLLLDALKRHGVETQLWVMLTDAQLGDGDRVTAAVDLLRPIVVAAAAQGCTVGLYNHGGWAGEPENQVAIVRALDEPNVGIVYNLHHGHDHVDRFAAALEAMKPHLLAINLNGMDRDGERMGRKILPLGQGELDLQLVRAIVAGGYEGPLGILGHTQDDARDRLADNLDGLDWLAKHLAGEDPGPRPTPRTPLGDR